jgi:transaldolase
MNELSTPARPAASSADNGEPARCRERAPDALIDIPATEAGFAAAEDALFAGAGVNLTGVCSPRQVGIARAARRRALARRIAAHLPVDRIACAASMPLAAIDDAVDALLPPIALPLRGCAAAAAARIAVAAVQDDQAFAVFAAFGAAPLALRWLAPSAAHRAALSVASLDGAVSAQAVLMQLARHGIDLDTIGNDLLRADLTVCGHAAPQLMGLPV